MKIKIQSWLGQVSTVIGALIAAPVTVALIQHQITAEQAVPGILAAVVGLLWPEDQGLATDVETTATQVMQLVPALMAAYEHGRSSGASPNADSSISAEVQPASSSSSH